MANGFTNAFGRTKKRSSNIAGPSLFVQVFLLDGGKARSKNFAVSTTRNRGRISSFARSTSFCYRNLPVVCRTITRTIIQFSLVGCFPTYSTGGAKRHGARDCTCVDEVGGCTCFCSSLGPCSSYITGTLVTNIEPVTKHVSGFGNVGILQLHVGCSFFCVFPRSTY